MTTKARGIIVKLFEAFMAEPGMLPVEYQIEPVDAIAQARKIADYIAGMTDRYAVHEYRNLFNVAES